ncbi:reverse transcriptase-like protein [Sphingomonas sp. XXL09]|uniref:reverse transcriptase-like protein n=1 Tax=Sphingomonas sp. XXL09 TaxID=3457787 RepID=UPI00406BA923
MAAGVKVFFDGSSRPAPAGMAIAVVVRGVATVRRDLGIGSSMEAEWLALIAALQAAVASGAADVVLLGDAAAVIAQANGTVRCPPSCAHHLATFRAAPKPPGRWRLRYLRRTQNLAGIALEAR